MTAPLTIPARPFAFALPPGRAALIVIDMQRDFIEPGGFGESLGNDVSLLRAAVAPTQALLSAWRARGWPVVHTRESHRPDLSDCPSAKRERGQPSLRIGDPGPMGRLLVRGEPGCEIVPELAPLPGEIVIDKPGKGAFYGTALQAMLQSLGLGSEVAGDGLTALQLVQQEPPYDLILMDMLMPGIDGLEATRRLRQMGLTHRPWIVALTANAMQEDRVACDAAGMDDFLAKPLKTEDLRTCLERLAVRPVPGA